MIDRVCRLVVWYEGVLLVKALVTRLPSAPAALVLTVRKQSRRLRADGNAAY
jgi:hypothetical protein